MQDDFGELRSLLHGAPSHGTWVRLCRLLGSLDDDQLGSVAVPYAASHLRGWPDALRASPRRWLDAHLAGVSRPYWSLVRALDLEGRVIDHPLCTRLRSDLLGEPISTLLARDTHIEHQDAADLLDSPTLEHLAHVDLSRTVLTEKVIRLLADSDVLLSARILKLNACKLGNDGLRIVSLAHSFESLEHLELSDNRVGLMGLEMLADSDFACQLRRLDLSDNHIGRWGAMAVGQIDEVSHLVQLNLKNCDLFDEGLAALAAASRFEDLVEVNLESNSIRNDGIVSLVESGAMRSVEVLRLGGNKIGDAGLRALIESNHMPALRRLHMHFNPLSPESLEFLDQQLFTHDVTSADWKTRRL